MCFPSVQGLQVQNTTARSRKRPTTHYINPTFKLLITKLNQLLLVLSFTIGIYGLQQSVVSQIEVCSDWSIHSPQQIAPEYTGETTGAAVNPLHQANTQVVNHKFNFTVDIMIYYWNLEFACRGQYGQSMSIASGPYITVM